jgi:hypothetical protein
MFLISPIACIAAIILELALYTYIRQRSLQKRWGDVRAGLWVAVARFALIKLRSHEIDPRNWRPQILLFVGDATKRIGLVRLANWFNQNRGLVTASQLLVGDLKQEKIETQSKKQQMEKAFENEGLIAFSDINVVSDYENGIIDIVQSGGFAGLQSNTVMFGWPTKPGRLESILRIMRAVSNSRKSTIIARINWSHEPGQQKRIDIWWRGKQLNGDLMLLLAYLLSLNREWKDAKVVVRSIVEDASEQESMVNSLNSLLQETRIQAETEVVVRPKDKKLSDVIHGYSKNSDIVFMGLIEPELGKESDYAEQMKNLVSGLNTTIFVRNASEFAGDLI